MTRAVSHLRAILYALGGFTLWVISDSCIKYIGGLKAQQHEIMAASSVGGLVVILSVTALRGKLDKLKPRKLSALLLLGILHLCNFTFWILALMRLPLTNLYTVTFLSPIIVAMLAALFLREHISWKHALAIVAGFAGVAIAINPQELLHDSKDWASYGFVFASMVILSFMMLLLRVLGSRENREATAFYPRLVILGGSIAAGLALGYEPMPLKAFLFAFVSGGFGSLGWLFMAQAYKLAPAGTVAPFHYSEILSGALIGYFVFHDRPTMHVVVGAVIIIACGIYIITHTRKPALLLKEESHS